MFAMALYVSIHRHRVDYVLHHGKGDGGRWATESVSKVQVMIGRCNREYQSTYTLTWTSPVVVVSTAPAERRR